MAAVEYQSFLKMCEFKNYVERIRGCFCQPVIATMVPSTHLLRQLFMFLAYILHLKPSGISVSYPHVQKCGGDGL